MRSRGDAIGGGPRKPLRDGGDEPGEGGGWCGGQSGRGGRRSRHEPEKNKHQQRARRGCCCPISLSISSTIALRSLSPSPLRLSISTSPGGGRCRPRKRNRSLTRLSRLLLDRELTRRSRRPWFSERGGEEPCAAGKGASFQRYRKGESASVSPARIGYGFG